MNITDMTDAQLRERLKTLEARWNAAINTDEELGGGSPLEGLDEQLGELDNEMKRSRLRV